MVLRNNRIGSATSEYSGSISNAWSNAPNAGCTLFDLIVDSYTPESTSLSARGHLTLLLSTQYETSIVTGSIDFNNIPQVEIFNLSFRRARISFSEVQNVTISDSNFTTSPLYISSSSSKTVVTILRSILEQNTVAALSVTNGTLTVSNCTFSSNTQRAIYHNNAPTPLVVINSTFDNNSLSGNDGGAIWAGYNITITDGHFLQNSANQGGAIHSDGGSISCTRCYFDSNTATTGDGGSIWASRNIRLESSTVMRSITKNAGGIYGQNISIDNTTFYRNLAGDGGAIYCAGDVLQLNNTDILYNNATGLGGGIYMVGSTLMIYNEGLSNISYNMAGQSGGAIYAPRAYVTIEWAVFISNSALSPAGNGGAMMANTVLLDNTLLLGNSAGASGGALHVESLIADGTSFRNNTAAGAGGCVYGSGQVGFHHSNIIGCQSGSIGGGGVYADSVSIAKCYVAYNDALYGGGVCAIREITVADAVFSYNNALDGGGIYSPNSCSIVTSDFRNNTAITYPSYDISSSSRLYGVTIYPCDSGSTLYYTRGTILISGHHLNEISVTMNLRFQGQKITTYTRSDNAITFRPSVLTAVDAPVSLMLGGVNVARTISFDAFDVQMQDFLNTLYTFVPSLTDYMLNGSVTFSSDRLNLSAVTLQQNVTAEISTHLGGVTLPPGVIEPESMTSGSYLLYYTTREIPAEFETNVTTFAPVAGISLYHSNGSEIIVKKTETPIIIQFNMDRDNNSLHCGFWDESLLRWSTEGCNTTYSSLVYKCYCNHLTNFTIISKGNDNGNRSTPITGNGGNPMVSNLSGLNNGLGIILGAALGGCLTIVMVIVIIVLLYKRKMKRGASHISLDTVGELAGKIQYKSKIYDGNCSTVWEGLYSDTNQVAIKVVKIEYRARLMEEAISLRSCISTKSSPLKVEFVCQTLTVDGVAVSRVVMEWMNSGSLEAYMERHKLNSEMAYNIGSHVIKGLSYLEDNNVVHNQICPKKILLSIEGNVILAKICGFSRCVHSGHISPKEDRSAYSSPEAVQGQPVTPASDMWSFGILLWRIMSGTEPYQQQDKMYQQIGNGVVPQIEPRWNLTIRTIIEQCCRMTPKERMTPRAIVRRFQMSEHNSTSNVHDEFDPYGMIDDDLDEREVR
ncbi:filamentous hemagglutinin family outer membrane protein [Planoprotostelium fungivorum]|uniref:Filamentous hemagglutinin family outer membrane protein n=1 Tax=Planoprotostelium fungivorum TaxID=1890364 RepID=A0A2P6NDM0_9EUKA|nr:filamentous hemagglutinin family outer membrane protein [Planoprotostelium fungivorum]